MAALDPRVCYQALLTRDARFDGRLFVGVTSTGIYCRPVCPARTAKAENCRFFVSAAAAQGAGFRPCLRCRPETAPEQGAWRGSSNTVARGLDLIAAGALDGDEASVEQLAERLGVGERQLRRLFEQHLGASPIAVAQTRRVLFAKQLIHETRLPMTEVALAAGFGSVRRFNETFRALYQRPPSALRRKAVVALRAGSSAAAGVTLRLRYRAPYDWGAVLEHLRARAISGIECVEQDRYLRTWQEGGGVGSVEVSHLPEQSSLLANVRIGQMAALPLIVARIRRVFDLAADVTLIGAHLAGDPWLEPLIAARPGLRVPGGWDGFELAVRAILGQQVSVVAARQLGERLVRLCGSRALLGASLTRVFPSAERVAAAELSQLGMPLARRQTLLAVAQASLREPALFEAGRSLEETVARLRAVRGIGAWTAQYIALRAAREPDAFPPGDRGLLRGISRCSEASSADERARVQRVRGSVRRELDSQALEQRAQRWSPWRAYAAQHLWALDAAAPPSALLLRPQPALAVSGRPGTAGVGAPRGNSPASNPGART